MITLSLWSALTYAGAVKDGPATAGPVATAMVGPSAPVTVREADQKPPSSASVGVAGEVALRTIPTLSTQVSVNGLTLVPYVAAGFSGGYVTERDRAFHAVPSTSAVPSSTALGLRNLFGSHLIPNEVHLGIRVPF